MTNDPSTSAGFGGFPTTSWSFIEATPDRDAPGYREHVNRLILDYWRPVFYFLRARGYPLPAAEDLTQAFLLRLWDHDLIRRADPARGRFRTFLLAVLKHFLSDQGPRASRQKRFEEGLVRVSSLLGEEDRSYEPATEETPDRVYMKKWAAELVGKVREQLQKHCEQESRLLAYQVFAAATLDAPPGRPPTQEALAARFGLSRDQVRYALKQATDWYAELLRARVRLEVNSDADVGQEIRDLLDLIRA
jgi:RNA polymerase sigma-70 factor (ECF subfamily)